MNQALDLRALKYATQKVEDFTRVHQGRKPGEREESIEVWLEYLGLPDVEREFLQNWMNTFLSEETGGMMVGLILGLYIREYERGHTTA